MSYMQLSAEATRLRRTAKAYAAGEIGITEYRRLRREVILSFVHGEDNLESSEFSAKIKFSEEDTQPRYPQRPKAHLVTPVAEKPKRRLWVWFSLSFLLLLGVVGAASAQEIIPELKLRSPIPSASLRVQVERLNVRNYQSLAGIDEEDIRAFLDAELARVREQLAPGPHGFSQQELVEVAKYLASIGVHDDKKAISASESRELLAVVQDQKAKRGMPLYEIEQIAVRLQNHLRKNGALVAVTYVPEQKVSNGVVDLVVLPGNLASVQVTGVKATSGFVAGAFASQIDKPVNKKDIESSFYQLSDSAGIRLQGEFVPGEKVGDTQLLLTVLDERALSAVVGIDNHGSQQLGDERAYVQASWINPSKRGDRLNFGFVQGINPSESNAGYISYEMPVSNDNDHVTVSLQRNGFDWRNNGLSVDGEAWIFDAEFERVIERSRKRSLKFNAHSGYHTLELVPGVDQKLLLAGVGAQYSRVLDDAQIYFDANVGIDVGHVSNPVMGQDENVWRAHTEFFAWRPVNLPWLSRVWGREFKIALRGQLQFSHQQLPETLRLGLGGHRQVRGFDYDIAAADRGLVVALEMHTPVAVGDLLFFADGAYGDQLNDNNPSWTQITSFGVGWQAQLFDRIDSELSISKPLSSKQTGGLDEDSARVYWSLEYQY